MVRTETIKRIIEGKPSTKEEEEILKRYLKNLFKNCKKTLIPRLKKIERSGKNGRNIENRLSS